MIVGLKGLRRADFVVPEITSTTEDIALGSRAVDFVFRQAIAALVHPRLSPPV